MHHHRKWTRQMPSFQKSVPVCALPSPGPRAAGGGGGVQTCCRGVLRQPPGPWRVGSCLRSGVHGPRAPPVPCGQHRPMTSEHRTVRGRALRQSPSPPPPPRVRPMPRPWLSGGGGVQGGFLVRSLVDGAGSYSVAHRAGLLPTELTGTPGWILLRSPHRGRGSPPSPRPH